MSNSNLSYYPIFDYILYIIILTILEVLRNIIQSNINASDKMNIGLGDNDTNRINDVNVELLRMGDPENNSISPIFIRPLFAIAC